MIDEPFYELTGLMLRHILGAYVSLTGLKGNEQILAPFCHTHTESLFAALVVDLIIGQLTLWPGQRLLRGVRAFLLPAVLPIAGSMYRVPLLLPT